MTHQDAFAAEALSSGEPAAPLSQWVQSIARRLAAWVETCADYWVTAAIYEQLSNLSDAELARRGLSRVTLAQDVCTACDRSGDA
jgi:hypothetical protein